MALGKAFHNAHLSDRARSTDTEAMTVFPPFFFLKGGGAVKRTDKKVYILRQNF